MIRDVARRGLFGLDRLLGGGGRGLILLYHRVADEPSDPYGLCVSPVQFREHLELLRELGRPMPVCDMARAVEDGALPNRAIGVTFDDAYIDVLETAVPLLMEYEIPATVFVTVGPEGREREFWWDELERIFFQSERLPEVLEMEIDGENRSWNLGDGPDIQPPPHSPAEGTGRPWHLNDEDVPTLRHAAFREVYHLLRPLPTPARTALMDRLLAWAGDRADVVRPTHRAMTPEEVAGMTRSGLIHAGAHTVSHPDLTSQTEGVSREEVRRSKSDLTDWIGSEVQGFAYPYGLHDPASASAVRDAGFAFACTGDYRSVRNRDDALLLPRIDVPAGAGRFLDDLARRFLG